MDGGRVSKGHALPICISGNGNPQIQQGRVGY